MQLAHHCRLSPTNPLTISQMLSALSFLVLILAVSATAADTPSDDEPVQVYFGNGCFFHTQHALVNQLEKVSSGSEATRRPPASNADGF